jgi:hypothetical protein
METIEIIPDELIHDTLEILYGYFDLKPNDQLRVLAQIIRFLGPWDYLILQSPKSLRVDGRNLIQNLWIELIPNAHEVYNMILLPKQGKELNLCKVATLSYPDALCVLRYGEELTEPLIHFANMLAKYWKINVNLLLADAKPSASSVSGQFQQQRPYRILKVLYAKSLDSEKTRSSLFCSEADSPIHIILTEGVLVFGMEKDKNGKGRVKSMKTVTMCKFDISKHIPEDKANRRKNKIKEAFLEYVIRKKPSREREEQVLPAPI